MPSDVEAKVDSHHHIHTWPFPLSSQHDWVTVSFSCLGKMTYKARAPPFRSRIWNGAPVMRVALVLQDQPFLLTYPHTPLQTQYPNKPLPESSKDSKGMGENFTLEHVYLYHRLPCHLQSLLKLLTALPLDFKLTTQQFDSCWLQKSGRPRCLQPWLLRHMEQACTKLITFPLHHIASHSTVYQIMLIPLAVQHLKRPQFVVLHFHRPSWDALLLKTTN